MRAPVREGGRDLNRRLGCAPIYSPRRPRPTVSMAFSRSLGVSQVAEPAQIGENEIDLGVVREILSHFTYSDFQEAQELILSALQEINEHFGWVSLEAAKVVADYFGTTDNRVY